MVISYSRSRGHNPEEFKGSDWHTSYVTYILHSCLSPRCLGLMTDCDARIRVSGHSHDTHTFFRPMTDVNDDDDDDMMTTLTYCTMVP